MSAPPGWHPQPDGRERWWDGQQWTEHFRDPAEQTQRLDQQEGYGQGYGQTQQYAQTQQYGDPGPAAYPQAGYGAQGGYGTPGGQYPPQKQGMSRGLKGCLIAVVVFLILAIAAVVVAVFVFGTSVKNAVDDVQQSIDEAQPADPGGPDVVVIQVGQGFDAGPATVEDGWQVTDNSGFGQKVDGMEATFEDGQQTPSLFTMRFRGEDGSDVETVCTAVPSEGGGPSDVTCVPLFGTVDPDAEVEVSPTL